MSGGSVNSNRKWEIREEREKKTISFPPELYRAIEKARGDQSVNAWVVEACRTALYYETGKVTG